MTDEFRLPDPIRAASKLPDRSAIIVRHRDDVSRAEIARQLRPIATQRGLMLLISEDPALAHAIEANGLHLPERIATTAHHWKALRPNWLITAAAHSIEALARAARAGADAALLAPIFPTRSHPERGALGVSRARIMAGMQTLPLYALGGVSSQTARRLTGSLFVGFAVIDALSAAHSE